MKKILLLTALAAVSALAFACGSTPDTANSVADVPRPGGGTTPTEAYVNLYNAVKAKNTEEIKAQLTLKTQAFAEMISKQQNVPVEKVLENGFSATTFAPTLPETRDERIDGRSAAVEVWNAKDNVWHDIPLIFEGGAWRVAIGDEFGGTFKSPGKGRAMREREAANLSGNNKPEIRMPPGVNSNTNVKPIVPKQVPPPPPMNK